jgi:hypothetical protein
VIAVASAELSGSLEPVPGFIESNFNPLVYHAAAQCLRGRELNLTGPLLSMSTVDDDPLDTAELLLADPELDAVLLLTVELAADERTAAVYRLLGRTPPTTDGASALLLERDPQ